MRTYTLTLLVAIYGSVGIHATDLHRTYPHYNDALHNGPPPLMDPGSSKDSSYSDHDPSLDSPGLYDDHPDSSGLYESPHSNHGFQQDPDSDNFPNPLSQLFSPNSLSLKNNIRSRRDPSSNKAHDILHDTAIVAHIANGIALQFGLVRDEIKIDDLVGELLKFGDVPVSSVVSFNPRAIINVNSQLKSIQSSLNSKFKEYEDQALNWNALIESLPIGNWNDQPGREAYLNELRAIDRSVFELLSNPMIYLRSIHRALDDLDFSRYHLDLFGTQTVYNFQRLVTSLNGLVESVPIFWQTQEKLRSTELNTGTAVYESIERMIDLVLKRINYNMPTNEENRAAIKANLKAVSKLSKDFKSSSEEFFKIADIAVSKSNKSLLRKQFSEGFPNGPTDINKLISEVSDSWIRKMTGAEGSLTNGLTRHLQPLFSMNSRLVGLDEKLKTLLSETPLKSLTSMKQLQRDISNVTPESVDISDEVLQGFEDCEQGVPSGRVSIEHIEVAQYVKTLKILINLDLAGFDLKDFDSQNKKFIESLGFSDLSNKTKALEELSEGKFNDLKYLRKRIVKVNKLFDAVNFTINLNASVDHILEHENGISASYFSKDEQLHKCLHQFRDKSAKVAHAIATTQLLRESTLEEIPDVETAVSIMHQVSKGLATIKSLPERMTKEPRFEFLILDSMKMSDTIGQAVSSLHYAYTLKQMESEIAQLKSVKDIVETEIDNITSHGDRKQLEDLWGNHDLEIASLEKTIADVKDFHSRLGVSKIKTIYEYGSIFKSMNTISDAKINALGKSIVLETLLSSPYLDSTVKSELVRSKKTLDRLSSLDLSFSSHKEQFENAPKAFDTLHDFLIDHLAIPLEPPNNSPLAIVSYRRESNYFIQFIIAIVVIVLLVVVVGGLIYFIKRQKKKKHEKSKSVKLDIKIVGAADSMRKRDWIQFKRNSNDSLKMKTLEHERDKTTKFAMETMVIMHDALGVWFRNKRRFEVSKESYETSIQREMMDDCGGWKVTQTKKEVQKNEEPPKTESGGTNETSQGGRDDDSSPEVEGFRRR